jgi:hypothetical protein
MGTSRRVQVDDPRTDAAICVLEAAARHGPRAASGLLAEGRAADDPAVRWTAERLEQALARRSP